VQVQRDQFTTICKDTVGWSATTSVLGTELTAIARALGFARGHLLDARFIVVITDSQHALKAIAQGDTSGSKRAQLARISYLLGKLDETEVHTVFKWIPAHSGAEGNERADNEAREMTQRLGAPTRPKTKRHREAEGVITLIHKDINKKRQRQPTP